MIKRIALIVTINLFALNSRAALCATDICTVPAGGNTDIDRHGICYKVANSGAKDLMIPTLTQPQLQSFISASAIAGITKTVCQTPPQFIAPYTNNVVYATAACTVNKPTNLAVGDLLLALIYAAPGPTGILPPTGFTISGANHGAQCGSYRSAIYYKIADASDVAATNFQFTKPFSTYTECGISMLNFRDVSASTPIQAKNNNTGNGTTATILSATSTIAQSLSVAFIESCNSGAISIPTGYTSVADITSQYTRVVIKALPTAGATGDVLVTVPGGFVGSHVILNPD